ncbi:AAA family ATPase [Umezawaea sp. Da 62-37]|uniref:AAA family ATPase n=1 Tax=Umezawaea sp. Da 62-37 TaxID=3075927 RepID=UPI0028F6DCAC|nr:AAA family ATPase [Umezawaea sp. Da 62-37]WNV85319.1 AAA family ATPase [Umezawaea sp. Da 62-37]
MTADRPAWMRELHMSLTTHPQILLVGNVRDHYLLPAQNGSGAVQPMDLGEVVELLCVERGFGALATFDIVHDRMSVWELGTGSAQVPKSLQDMAITDAMSGTTRDGDDEQPDVRMLRRLRQVLRDVVGHRGPPIGLFFPFAHRLGSSRSELAGEGKLLMAAAEALSHSARQVPGEAAVMPFNTVFWVTEQQQQMPLDFAISSRTVRVVTVPQASTDERRAAAGLAVATVLQANGVVDADSRWVSDAVGNLLSVTFGMTNSEILAVARVAIDQRIPVQRLDDAARLYRIGVKDNPWAASTIRKSIVDGEKLLTGTPDGDGPIGVLGQERAVRKAVDIFMRSAAGLSGSQSSSSPNRPRGVLFLAGPTGVGKTELAKGVTRMIFGSDAEPVRFDMTEFSQEHARERLIGAPPGFVGFDAGGELTNAIRATPMCVLLFDEIEKAHPRLFDIFLQILEDGRLTDGRGGTVYFSECVLIFTSNLGMTSSRTGGRTLTRLTHKSDPDDVRRVLEQAFVDFFDTKLGRPELRNRLGDSFIAMDFIRPEVVPQLLDKALKSVVGRAAAVHRIRLEIGTEARQTLHDRALETLDSGGRGVNTAVETLLINPLSRLLILEPAEPGEVWTVVAIKPADTQTEIEVSRCSG